MARWAGFHPRTWRWMNRCHSSVAPGTRHVGEGPNGHPHGAVNEPKCFKAAFPATARPPSYVLIPGSKKAGADR